MGFFLLLNLLGGGLESPVDLWRDDHSLLIRPEVANEEVNVGRQAESHKDGRAEAESDDVTDVDALIPLLGRLV